MRNASSSGPVVGTMSLSRTAASSTFPCCARHSRLICLAPLVLNHYKEKTAECPIFRRQGSVSPSASLDDQSIQKRSMTHAKSLQLPTLVRRVIKYPFSIIAHHWRCMLTTPQMGPRKTTKVMKATFVQHNLLRERLLRLQANEVYEDSDDRNVIPVTWC